MKQANLEKQKQIAQERRQYEEDFAKDPWLGYSSLDEALADYRCSTQAEVMARLLSRENVFISGPAGSGKTTLINKFIKLVDAEYAGAFEVALTASTGIAATLIGGSTIHSWAGLGISTEPFDAKNIPKQIWPKVKNLIYADVLIIDEISMLPAYLFEKLDAVMKYFRRSDEPFGGVQMVLMGDFLQLPPVDKNEPGVDASFAITTHAWKELAPSYCYMDKTHRATDPQLVNLLSHMARDRVNDEMRELVKTRMGQQRLPNKTYTTLFTTNQNVDRYNEQQQAGNSGAQHLFKIKLGERTGKKDADALLKSHGIQEELKLKIGDTVILTTNMVSQNTFLANGSLGVIIRFAGDAPAVKFNNGETHIIGRKAYVKTERRSYREASTGKEKFFEEETARIEQIPLKLGYAITVHRSQGQTFDGVEVDLSKCFTPGLGYVALSRVRALDDLIVRAVSDQAYRVNPRSKKVANFVKKKALLNRESFVQQRDTYVAALTSNLYRSGLWNVEQSGSHRRPKV